MSSPQAHIHEITSTDTILPSTSLNLNSNEIDLRPKQVGGNHYRDMRIQPIDYTLANDLGYCEGNVIKYVSRYRKKNGLEDLEKAKHYIEILIGRYKNEKI